MRSVTGAVILVLVGCGGDRFGQDSPAGDDVAGAPSSAGSIGTGGAVMPSGGRAGGPSSSESGEGGAGDVEPPQGAPCDVSTWKAAAFATSVYLGAEELPAFMLDGDVKTRWASGVEREAGQWLELELAGDTLQALELRNPTQPLDLPEELDLVLDGKRVDVVISKPSEGVLRLELEPTLASSARLELTSSAAAWWSVAELSALCR